MRRFSTQSVLCRPSRSHRQVRLRVEHRIHAAFPPVHTTRFVYVWIIQFTAFLMTLRRKNLAPHGPLVVGYGSVKS